MSRHTINHKLDESTEIWRYFDIFKFTYLICQRELWFSRADLLGDDHEGSLPDSLLKQRKSKWSDERVRTIFERGSKEGLKNYYVNCWSKKNPESYLMWKIYTANSVGVAIKSTIERLSKCFIKNPGDYFERDEARIEKMKYIDYRSYENNTEFDCIIYKQTAYSYEEEIRIIMNPWPSVNEPRIGIGHKVDLDILIDKIYISHRLGDGYDLFVEDLLNKNCVKKKPFYPTFVRSPTF